MPRPSPAAPPPVAAAASPQAPDDVSPRLAPAPVQRARAFTLVLLIALILLCLAWELWLAPTGRGTLALKALPLLPCLAGLLRHRLYTYRWLGLLVWLYMTEGLVRSTSESGLSQALALAEVGLAGLLFVLCVHYIGLRLPRRPRRPRNNTP